MKLNLKTFAKTVAVFCVTLAILPAVSMAQNRPQAGEGLGTGGGMGGGAGGLAGPIAPMLQALRQLNLPADEMQKVQGVIRQAVEDLRDSATGIRQANQQERIQKMEDAQKIITDAKDKVLGILTPEQKAKYFPLFAKLLVKQAGDRLNAMQTASAKMEITEDEHSQLKSLFDDDQKSLDGYKTDAETVKDDQAASELQQKITKQTAATRKQLVDILGQDGVQQLMQNMRPGAQTGNRAARNAAKGATSQASPTTRPAAK